MQRCRPATLVLSEVEIRGTIRDSHQAVHQQGEWCMATEVRLPQWSMGMQDGTVVRWLKKEGDPVSAGEAIAEIEAAKVTGTLEAPVAGVILRILVLEGATVPVRTPLCLIGAREEALAAAPGASLSPRPAGES